MWKTQTRKSESWAHGEVNTCPDLPWWLLLLPGPLPPTPGLPRLLLERGQGLSPTLSHGVPRMVTCAESQSLPLPNNQMRSADRCGGFWSALQGLYLN